MGINRVFFPQEALDSWLEDGRIQLDGDEMTLNPDGQKFRLQTAVRFIEEVAEGSDPHDLVGKVKTVEQIAELQGEHYNDSVVIGDHAYEVREGFIGEPLALVQGMEASVLQGSSLEGATRAAVGDVAPDEPDPLTRFFLGR